MALTTYVKGRAYDWSHAIGRAAANGTGFNYPQTMCLGNDGDIFVANRGNENTFAMRVNRVKIGGPGEEELLAEFCTYGETDGHSIWPFGVAVDKHDTVYVTDEWTNTVSVFDAAGKFIRKWGTPGSGPGELKNPAGIICDAGGNVIVVDSGNDRLQVFTPDGKALIGCGPEKVICLWDAATGKERGRLEGHRDWVNALALTRDGKTLASASQDRTVRLWNLAALASRPGAGVVAPAPAPRQDEFGPEVKGLRAKVTLAKEKFEAGEAVSVKYAVKNVSKQEQIVWHSGFWPNHLILVHDAGGKEPLLTPLGRQCRKSFSPGGERSKNVPVKVPAGGEDAAYEQYDLAKLYDLSRPGRYTVQYVYEEKQGGWEGRLPSNVAAFEVVAPKKGVRLPGSAPDPTKGVRPGVAESRAVRVNGADFRVAVESPMRVPAVGDTWLAGESWPGSLGLRIRNTSDKPLVFSNRVRFRVTLPDGTPLRVSGGADGKRPAQPYTVQPGKDLFLPGNAFLQWTPDGKTLRLNG